VKPGELVPNSNSEIQGLAIQLISSKAGQHYSVISAFENLWQCSVYFRSSIKAWNRRQSLFDNGKRISSPIYLDVMANTSPLFFYFMGE
jgi:hypothetical protein